MATSECDYQKIENGKKMCECPCNIGGKIFECKRVVGCQSRIIGMKW